ncbi:MAG: tRNA uridine-5-carboxymethylaminomethyl(34) synthesis GTPase MnmE, partial [Gammaproteobacteria bacterium]|nr:tRNA uridine-5-carboxymethylaminomethyl(34) synthesis GTPase MnmE [Gammaproteobacteria bacterium]
MDTIAAIATPPGFGGVGIVRVSGPKCRVIAECLLGFLPQARKAEYTSFIDPQGRLLDQGLALYFSAPNSFTGEDVLELQAHGGPVVLDLILKAAINAGARTAQPGEFSQRAFLNGKMDLAQCEAISDLINASTEQAARSAVASLQGEFSRLILEMLEQLIQTRVYIESYIDFVEEEIDFLSDKEIDSRLNKLKSDLQEIVKKAGMGRLLNEGMSVVIIGPPNAGKSSLLNRLVQDNVAIVTPIAGTTRDVLRERINIDGMPLHILDTAGLREDADLVEQEGIRRALIEAEKADRLLLVLPDEMQSLEKLAYYLALLPPKAKISIILNKIDLSQRSPGLTTLEGRECIALSTKSDLGLEELRTHLKNVMGYQSSNSEGIFTARQRHLTALNQTIEAIEKGKRIWHQTHAVEL